MLNFKRVIVLGVILTVMAVGSEVSAEGNKGVEKDLQEIELEQEEVNKELKEKTKKLNKLLTEIEEKEEEKASIEEILKRNKKDVDKAEKAVKEVEEEIEKVEHDVSVRQDIMGKRMQAYQKSGDTTYLDVLMGSSSFTDFIDRASAVTTILDADNRLVEELEESIEKLDEKLKEREELKDTLKEIEDANKEQKDKLEETIEGLQKDNKKVKKEVKKLKVSKKELGKLQEKVREDMGMKKVLTGDKLEWPTDGGYISSNQGTRVHPITGKVKTHNGMDIARTDRSTSPPIYAAESGKVVNASFTGGFGNMVKIEHGDGVQTIYAHMSKMDVKVGQQVKRGERLGVMGTTGDSTGIHLHFEVHVDGKVQNPINYLGDKK